MKNPVPDSTIDLHPIEASPIQARRERVFLLLAGIFLGTLAMLNILGISRFIVLFSLTPEETGGYSLDWGQMGKINFALAVGVLPYPITFLCTDLISEFYGRRRANWVVTVGLVLNLWVMFILWLGGILPDMPDFNPDTKLPDPSNREYAFYAIRMMAFGAVAASMIAYMVAQFCDVFLYHFWKKLTQGKHLWLRNNGSTLISQLVDTIAVILITHFYAKTLPPPSEGQSLWSHLALFIATSYVFKLIVALLDTIPLYLCVAFLKNYLQFDPVAASSVAASKDK